MATGAMAFLKNLFKRPVDWKALFPDAPEVATLPAPVGGENAIHAILDHVGFPWRESGKALVERYGTSRDGDTSAETCKILPDPMQLRGLIRPFAPPSWMLDDPLIVPTSFDAHLWIGNDAAANIRLAHEQLVQQLGPAPIGVAFNTVYCGWRAGPAKIEAMIYPPELDTYSLHKNIRYTDLRLMTAVRISIKTSYRRPMSAEERDWLRSFRPIAKIIGSGTHQTLDELWSEMSWGINPEVLRQPPADQDNFLGQIGLSADGKALIVCKRELLIVPMARVTGLRLDRLYPAKGAGGSRLSVNYKAERRETSFCLSDAVRDIHALDELADRLARRLDLPLEVPEPQDDY